MREQFRCVCGNQEADGALRSDRHRLSPPFCVLHVATVSLLGGTPTTRIRPPSGNHRASLSVCGVLPDMHPPLHCTGRRRIRCLASGGKAFIEEVTSFPKHLARRVHELYFQPVHEKCHWSLSNAFTSAFKELEPTPQYKATVKLAGFLQAACIRNPQQNCRSKVPTPYVPYLVSLRTMGRWKRPKDRARQPQRVKKRMVLRCEAPSAAAAFLESRSRSRRTAGLLAAPHRSIRAAI